ncbi:MAG: GH92 family glycosyl hydrolase [Bacteroidaceae bacterium]|nr:GH92 family glycosyl hydrolase [Bacteroidaceae bacterium]
MKDKLIEPRMKHCASLLVALLLMAGTATTQAQLTQYVNPLIGTGRIEGALRGNNYPGATVPFGLVQLSPDTREAPDWDCPAGYAHEEETLYGFSHTHLSGTGAADLVDIALLPVSQERRVATIDHTREVAQAGYYSVPLREDDILAELTATTRTGVHRYTYAEGQPCRVFLDLDHSCAKGSWGRRIERAQLRIVDAYTVEGFRIITGWAPLRKVCFSIRFSRPIVAWGGWCDGRTIASSEPKVQSSQLCCFTANGTDIKVTLTFGEEPDKPATSETNAKATVNSELWTVNSALEARVGISAVSIENARFNREKETQGKTFDQLRAEARQQWEEALGGIRADFDSRDEATIFYTALYHAMQQPNTFSDVNGQYARADYYIGNAREGHDQYTMFSIWDTYRAAHALYDLLQPRRAADMVNSMLDHAEHYGYLPIWELWGEDNYCMIGNHAVSVVVEAIRKGVPDIDEHRAWRAVRQTLSTPHRDSPWPVWERLGYMPENLQTQSVSITLEDAYDDWCAARLAERLGLTDEMEHFDALARNYRNLYNRESGLFQPKDDKGQWLPGFDALRYGANGGSAYTEGNAWQWRWSVQHDVDDLIALSGGPRRFAEQLDYFFTCHETSGEKNDNASGFIGLYAHGNEPSHHVSFLYTLAGQPQKTDQLVSLIRSTMYNTQVSGYIGNDDCGEMSAWYVFAALGLYPLNPASGDYVLFAPSVREATLPLPNGKTFRIEAERRGRGAVYVKNIRWNGQKLTQPMLSNDEILKGGTLHFELTAKAGGKLLPLGEK